MSKFGDLVNSKTPVLIDFYSDWNGEQNNILGTLQEVAIALGEKAKVIKIDIGKNETLAKALRIKTNPTFIIYKDSEMKWRQSGNQEANTLIEMVEQFV